MAPTEKRYLALRQSSDSAGTYSEVSGDGNEAVGAIIDHPRMKAQTLFTVAITIVLLCIIVTQAVHTAHLQDAQRKMLSPSMPPPPIKSSVYRLTLFSMV